MSSRGRGSSAGGDEWNPMENAYNDGAFNSYTEGPGIGHQPTGNRRHYSDKPTTISLFVGNVDKSLKREGLENLFATCSGVKPLSIFKKEDTDGTKTFAFVEFATNADAENAIRTVHDQPPHHLTVKYKRTDEEKKRSKEERTRQGFTPAPYRPDSQSIQAPPTFSNLSMNMAEGVQQAGFGKRAGRNSVPTDPNDVACESARDGFYDPNSAGNFEDVDRSVMAVVDSDAGNNFSIQAGSEGRKVSYGRGYHPPSASSASPRTNSSNRTTRSMSSGEPDVLNGVNISSRSASRQEASSIPEVLVAVPVCQMCMRSANNLCLMCKMARYCSKSCADEHWPAHKFLCILSVPPPGICVADENVDMYKVQQIQSHSLVNNSKSQTNGSPGLNVNASRSQGCVNSSVDGSPNRQNTENNHSNGRHSTGNISNAPARIGEIPVTPSTTGNLNQRFAPNRQSLNSSFAPNRSADLASTSCTEPVIGGEWQKMEELPQGVFSKVIVTTAHATDLWVQYDSNFMKLNKIIQGLEKASKTLAPCDPKVNQVFAANYEGEWHRAKVLSVTPTLRVIFIDYGNEEVKKPNDIRMLPDEFAGFRAQAICIKLRDATPDKYRCYPSDTFMSVKPVSKNADGSIVVDLRGEPGSRLVERTAQPTVPRAVPVVKPEGAHKMQELPASTFTKVVALSAPGPGQADNTFLISIVDMSSELLKLLESLSSLSINMPKCEAKVGAIVAAEYEEGWYRAKVVGLSPIRVLFIDYGNEETVSPNQVRVLPEEYFSMLAQAMRVKLVEGSTLTTVKVDSTLMVKPVSKAADGCVVIELQGDTDSSASSTTTATSPTNVATNAASYHIMATDNLACNHCVELQPDTFTEVAVRVPGSNDCYVNICANGRQIDEQMSKMMAEKRGFITCTPTLNMLVAASLDGKIYRAKVVDVSPLKVWCIDFGKMVIVDQTMIRLLPREFTSLPMQAIKISLLGGSSSSQKKLLLDARLFVKPVDKLSDGSVVVEVKGETQNQGPSCLTSVEAPLAPTLKSITLTPSVASSVMISNPGETEYWVQLTSTFDALISDLVGAMCNEADTFTTISSPKVGHLLAAKCEGVWYRMTVVEIKGSLVKGHFIDYGFEETVAIDDIRALPQKYAVLPAQAIKIELAAGTPRKYHNLADEAVIMVKPVGTTSSSGAVIVQVKEAASTPVRRCNTSIALPPGEFTEVIYVVKDDGKLWIQPNNVVELTEIMKIFNSNIHNLVRCEVEVGTMVAVQFEGLWSRAKVVAVEPRTQIQFIDYGNLDFATADELRALPADLLDIPSQAIRITLAPNTPEAIRSLVVYENTFFAMPVSEAPDGSIIVQAHL